MSNLINTARNAARPSSFPEMVRKVYLRGRYGSREATLGRSWAEANATDMVDWATRIDEPLWRSATTFADEMDADAQSKMDELARLGIKMGGGGCSALLYFLARRTKPDTVLETGVAAGWSTRAFLSAIAHNGRGQLLSSDFPYFRIEHPERYIAYVVPDELKGPWKLFLKGDRVNLRKILTPGLQIDLAHYDSDKSRGGRQLFWRLVSAHLGPDALLIMDDIGDDLFFRDVSLNQPFRVFPYGSKYIGLLGTE